MSSAHEVTKGCAVVLVDDRLGAVIPAAALPLLRAAAAVYAEPGLSAGTHDALEAPAPPPVADLLVQVAREPVVLVAPDLASAEAEALYQAGVQLVTAPPPAGVELLDAVTVMDRLRSPGGCPWDADQTHESLRQYLVEETYELLDAIEHNDRAALREELGDVLLQILFHARVAAEDAQQPFGVDEVAAELVSKLVSRHPHVFAGSETVHDSESQQLRWEELKQREKQRESIMDGVAMAQPAVALAGKLASRAGRADFPPDLIPDGSDVGEALFALAARAKLDDLDPEDALRTVAKRFDQQVRAAEASAKRAGRQARSADVWREFWHDPVPPDQSTLD